MNTQQALNIPGESTTLGSNVHVTHCDRCISRNCIKTAECRLLTCLCEAIYHECKHEDHLHICRRALMECINSENGCPESFPRHNLSKHLRLCPANVIICTFEWQRTPLFMRNEFMKFGLEDSDVRNGSSLISGSPSRIPIATEVGTTHARKETCKTPDQSQKDNDDLESKDDLTLAEPEHDMAALRTAHLNSEQLDVAAALRDQRLINSSFTLSPTLRRRLCSDLTPYHPMLPLVNLHPMLLESSTSRRVEDSRECSVDRIPEATWVRERSPAGLASSIVHRLSLCNGLGGCPCVPSHGEVACGWQDVAAAVLMDHADETAQRYKDFLLVDLRPICLSRFERKPFPFSFCCARLLRRDEFASHYSDHSDIDTGVDGHIQQRCPLNWMGCRFSVIRYVPEGSTGIRYNRQFNCWIKKTLDQSYFGSRETTPQMETASNINSPVRIRTSASHVERIHSNVEPIAKEMFIPAYSSSVISSATRKRHLLDLPNEILLPFILEQLDSTSLRSVSQTCSFLRNLCEDLLVRKGIVTGHWEPVTLDDGSPVWRITHWRWRFSDGTEEIKSWKMTETALGALSNHLATCSYNRPIRNSQPFNLAATQNTD